MRVECNGVMLKLTLSQKLLRKPFKDAVLTPFLKAYSKKATPPIHPPIGIDKIYEVTIDSEEQRGLKKVSDVRSSTASTRRSPAPQRLREQSFA